MVPTAQISHNITRLETVPDLEMERMAMGSCLKLQMYLLVGLFSQDIVTVTFYGSQFGKDAKSFSGVFSIMIQRWMLEKFIWYVIGIEILSMKSVRVWGWGHGPLAHPVPTLMYIDNYM